MITNLNNEADPDVEGPRVFFVPEKTEDALHLLPGAELVVLLQQEGCLKPVSGWRCRTRGEFDLLVAVVELYVKVCTESLKMRFIVLTNS